MSVKKGVLFGENINIMQLCRGLRGFGLLLWSTLVVICSVDNNPLSGVGSDAPLGSFCVLVGRKGGVSPLQCTIFFRPLTQPSFTTSPTQHF